MPGSFRWWTTPPASLARSSTHKTRRFGTRRMSEENTPAEAEAAEQDIAAIGHVEAMAAEIQSLKEQVLRFAAEAENIKRRAEREANDARAYAITKFARDLLGVADNLSRALAARPESAEAAVANFVVGVEMTEKELQGAFERNGL